MSLLSSSHLPHRAEKRCFGKLDTRTSDGSQQSEPSTESAVTRQPCKSRIRNQRFSRVFRRVPTSRPASGSVSSSVSSSVFRPESRPMSRPVSMASGLRASLSNPSRKASTVSTSMTGDDPSELSNHVTAPGVLKIFGSEICQGAHYKSVLATTQSSAKELVKEALERYGLTKEEADSYVLCDTIGSVCEHQWKTEAFRVVGDNEKPLLLQSLWKPREGLARRFEIQKRSSVEERASQEKDTVTAGINAQARKLQKSRSRVSSSLSQRSGGSLWRSRSSTDMLLCHSHHSLDTSPGQRCIQESTGDSAITEALCEPGARIELEEKEETESCGDRAAQYSIHPPHDCPYLLLLKGHSQTQDFIIYLLSDPIVTVGRASDPSSDLRAEVMLWANDILPVHCQLQRGQSGGPTVLCPGPGAEVLLNGERLSADATLSSGDVIGLGHSYLFVFKEPPTPDFFAVEPLLCHTCLSTRHRSPPSFRSSQGHTLTICFSTHDLDTVVKEIVEMGKTSSDRPPLTVAFLLCACIQHCATSLQASHLRRLLLLSAGHLQTNVWELTKELASVQPEDIEPRESDHTEAVISGLYPLVLWMSNNLELLHFIQFQLPLLLDWRGREEQGHTDDTQHNMLLQMYLSSVQSAMEETIAVLEEVIMLAFQQCVYYITKVLYPLLPGLLDCNPFRGSADPTEPADTSSLLDTPALQAPEEVQMVVEVLSRTWALRTESQLHPDITAQLVGYLFYFINASLFNSLMERGSEVGFYQWSRGVQMRASLDLLLDWAHDKGLGELASEQTLKLTCALNLLATPRKTLLKSFWGSLRSLYPALHPAQLHHLLSLYRTPSQPVPPHRSAWSPCQSDQAAAVHTSDILESFDSHHPLVLPEGGYHFQLEAPVDECGLKQQLHELRNFIYESREQQARPNADLQTDRTDPPASPPASSPESPSMEPAGALPLLSQTLQHLELLNPTEESHCPTVDSFCSLTPHHSPQPPHHSPQPPHHSPQPPHHSPQPPHHSPQPPHHSPQPPHHSPQPPHHSPQPPHHSPQPPQPPHHSPQPPHHSPQPPHHSPQPPHHSPQPPHHSPQPPHHSPQPPHHSPQPPHHSHITEGCPANGDVLREG